VVTYGVNWNLQALAPVAESREQYRMSSVSNGFVLWDGRGNTQVSGGLEWLSLNGDGHHEIDKGLDGFVKSPQSYSFLLQHRDVLVFQNHADNFSHLGPNFFGIKGLATSEEVKQTYLDDAAVRKLLADPRNTRYHVKGNLILDHGVPLIGDVASFQENFRDKGNWVGVLGLFPLRQVLANDLYFLSTIGSYYTVEASGTQIQKWVSPQPLEDNLYYSNMFPAPDGYIYQFRGDYKAGETRLYRIGPYPELKLDYHGKGGTINDDNVNLREESNTKSAAVTKLSKGTPVRIIDQTTKAETIAGQKGVWYQVRLWDRTEGWVFGAFLDAGKQ